MAGTFVVAPDGFELVGDPVPTAQHWLTLPTRPVDFDPNAVWAYVQKLKEIESGKQFSFCVFCLKTFGSYNAIKMLQHPSGLYCTEIISCLGLSNGNIAVWIRDSCKAAVVKKANDLAAKKTLLLQYF